MAKVTPFACAAALATAKAWGERTIQAMEGSDDRSNVCGMRGDIPYKSLAWKILLGRLQTPGKVEESEQ